MAYFNHAFCKSFLVTDVANTPGILPQSLVAGQLGAADGNWAVLDPTNIPTTPLAKNMFYLAQGSYSPSDTVGTHGGYQESVKTKGINPRYVTRIWSSVCQTAVAATTTIDVACDCAPCGENLFLRLDVKGSPALRFLNHNSYAIGDSSGDAYANGASLPGLCCTSTQTHLDPAMALAAAAQMLLADPLISPFVAEGTSGNVATVTLLAGGSGYTTASAVVTTATAPSNGTGLLLDTTAVAGALTVAVINANNGGKGYAVGDVVSVAGGTAGAFTITTVAAGGVVVSTTAVPYTSYTIAQILDGSTYTASTDPCTDGVTSAVTFQGAYVDTQFGTCSFDTRDHHEMEPVQLIGSLLDETGNPCNTCGVVTNTAGVMAQTHSDTVLKRILLHERYLQNPYHQGSPDSVRISEIEGFDPIKTAVRANNFYKTYYLQHSIPRLNNPTGTFDNDQYVYEFFVPCGGAAEAEMETLLAEIVDLCVAYGNPITFESDADQL